jgi:hypothetical protein
LYRDAAKGQKRREAANGQGATQKSGNRFFAKSRDRSIRWRKMPIRYDCVLRQSGVRKDVRGFARKLRDKQRPE